MGSLVLLVWFNILNLTIRWFTSFGKKPSASDQSWTADVMVDGPFSDSLQSNMGCNNWMKLPTFAALGQVGIG